MRYGAGMAKRDKRGSANEASGADSQAGGSDLEVVPVGQERGEAGSSSGAERQARLERARELAEEVRRAGRMFGRPYDRDVLRLIEAVLEVAASGRG